MRIDDDRTAAEVLSGLCLDEAAGAAARTGRTVDVSRFRVNRKENGWAYISREPDRSNDPLSVTQPAASKAAPVVTMTQADFDAIVDSTDRFPAQVASAIGGAPVFVAISPGETRAVIVSTEGYDYPRYKLGVSRRQLHV